MVLFQHHSALATRLGLRNTIKDYRNTMRCQCVQWTEFRLPTIYGYCIRARLSSMGKHYQAASRKRRTVKRCQARQKKRAERVCGSRRTRKLNQRLTTLPLSALQQSSSHSLPDASDGMHEYSEQCTSDRWRVVISLQHRRSMSIVDCLGHHLMRRNHCLIFLGELRKQQKNYWWLL